jgi:LacI family transcriptional regulator
VDESLIVGTETLELHGFTQEAGYAAMQRLLALPAPPDAVFVASDVQALGVLGALQEAGLRVPDDVALVGFDDIRASAYVGLTTLRQPMYEMGRVAIEKLLQRMEAPGRPVSVTAFSPHLVVRETCGARVHAGGAGTPSPLPQN